MERIRLTYDNGRYNGEKQKQSQGNEGGRINTDSQRVVRNAFDTGLSELLRGVHPLAPDILQQHFIVDHASPPSRKVLASEFDMKLHQLSEIERTSVLRIRHAFYEEKFIIQKESEADLPFEKDALPPYSLLQPDNIFPPKTELLTLMLPRGIYLALLRTHTSSLRTLDEITDKELLERKQISKNLNYDDILLVRRQLEIVKNWLKNQ